jgi:hypothetical protein
MIVSLGFLDFYFLKFVFWLLERALRNRPLADNRLDGRAFSI